MINFEKFLNKELSYKVKGETKTVSGKYPVISNKSIVNVYNTTINSNKSAYLTFNNSKLYSDNTNTLACSIQTEPISISLNNTLSYITTSTDTNTIKHIQYNNSFTNFLTLQYNENIECQVGGACYILNNVICQDKNIVWTSNLATDGYIEKGLYWQTLNQNSYFVKDSTIKTTLANGSLSDKTNITNCLLYDADNSPNGWYKTITFNVTVSDDSVIPLLSVENKKNIYAFTNITSGKIDITDFIAENIAGVTFNKYHPENLSAINTDITIVNYNTDKTINYNTDNTTIRTTYEITTNDGYANCFNTKFIRKLNASNYATRTTDTVNYLDGYAVLVNETGINTQLYQVDTRPETGNEILDNKSITVSVRNAAYKYGLEGHTHKSYSSNKSNFANGTIFPSQSSISHNLLSYNNYKTLLNDSNSCSYYPLSTTINENLIPQQTLLPVGSIIGFYQYNTTSGWLPKIPFGFYLLTDAAYTVVADFDDPLSPTYNAELEKNYGSDNGLITIPAGKTISIQSGKARIVQILKYAEYWERQENLFNE